MQDAGARKIRCGPLRLRDLRALLREVVITPMHPDPHDKVTCPSSPGMRRGVLIAFPEKTTDHDHSLSYGNHTILVNDIKGLTRYLPALQGSHDKTEGP